MAALEGEAQAAVLHQHPATFRDNAAAHGLIDRVDEAASIAVAVDDRERDRVPVGREAALPRRRQDRKGAVIVDEPGKGGEVIGRDEPADRRLAEAWVGDIQADGTVAKARRVAGGPDESVFQPSWSPDGDLYFISDRGSGWWNLYRERDGAIEPLAPMDAEFGQAQWNFAMSTYAFESAERIVCCFVRDGVWRLAQLDPRTRRFDPIALPFTSLSQLRAGPGRAVFLVMLRTYRGLLDEIERRDFDVFRERVRLSRLRKLWLAASALPVRWGWI